MSSARRAPRPDDLYRFRIPTDPQLAPDGRSVVCCVQRVAPGRDGYRSALWRVALAADGSADGPEHRLTLGSRNDHSPRFSPDGTRLAFLSDRRPLVEEELGAPREREDAVQVHVLPLDRPGEAQRLTDLPRGVDDLAWSPDGTRLAVVSASLGADRASDDRARRRLPEPPAGSPPVSDYWFIDRLQFLSNGAGVVAGRRPQLWLVDARTGVARRLTDLAAGVGSPAFSPDGSRIAVVTGRSRDDDLSSHTRIVAVSVADGSITPIAEHRDAGFHAPAWLPDGRSILALGGDHPHGAYRADIWRFAADGSEAAGGQNLSARFDLMPASTCTSDVTITEPAGLWPTPDGSAVLFRAPVDGSTELWRLGLSPIDRDPRPERLTDGRHELSSAMAVDAGGGRIRVAVVRSTPTELPEVHLGDLRPPGGGTPARPATLRPVTSLNAGIAAEVALRPPVDREAIVDARRIQGWLIPAGDGARPTVLEIHGGPHTFYGQAPMWEFQLLAAAGISVAYANPRGSEGYGLDFNEANLADWGAGPMRDVMAIVDGLVSDGLADPTRLGVTGGSYGGYLTNWIVAHDRRFAAAVTCRSVSDLALLMLSGDLSGTDWPAMEFGAYPWEDPERFRALSPITYARDIRTPLLIQHAEQDLRTTIAQAEMLFSVLRRHRRPVRLMRVPGESHELTRSGTPFRRVENLAQVRDWFVHYLVAGHRRLPRPPRTRHGT